MQCGVRLYQKRITDEPVEDSHVEATVGCWVALGDALSNFPAAIVHGPLVEDSFLQSERLRWPWPARVLAWPVIKPLDILLGGYHDKVGKRVGTFYPREWEYWSEVWRLAMVIAVIASAFGGIHCTGWSFIFPSSTEKKLWHVASVSITSIPVPLFLLLFLFESDLLDDVHDWLNDRVSQWIAGPIIWLMVLLVPLVPLQLFPLCT
jgi:hypothetical protein